MALSRVGFQVNRVQIHQVLGVHVSREGSSGMPLRPDWGAVGSTPRGERAVRAAHA
jgi:cyclopropane-fatty-acyl-phospholipid synthase